MVWRDPGILLTFVLYIYIYIYIYMNGFDVVEQTVSQSYVKSSLSRMCSDNVHSDNTPLHTPSTRTECFDTYIDHFLFEMDNQFTAHHQTVHSGQGFYLCVTSLLNCSVKEENGLEQNEH